MDDQQPAFRISEFGKRAKVSVRTLRFHEERGLIMPLQRNSSGYILYGLTELAKLQQIQSMEAKEMDFQFPTFLPLEETSFLEQTVKEMEALYNQTNRN